MSKHFGKIIGYGIGMYNERYTGKGFKKPTLCLDFVYEDMDGKRQELIKIKGKKVIKFIKKFNLDHLQDVEGKQAIIDISFNGKDNPKFKILNIDVKSN